MSRNQFHQELLNTFHAEDRKFRLACRQIRLLNHRIEDTQLRYDRAHSADRRSFRYTLRLQLATLEGMRNMFYEYACQRADDLEEMQERLISLGLVTDGSDEDEEEEEWGEEEEEMEYN